MKRTTIARAGGLALARHSWPAVAGHLALLAGLLLCCGMFLRGVPLQDRLDLQLGGADPLIARGFYDGETTTTGRGFRWTDGDSTLRLPPQGSGPHLLRLTISAPRPLPSTVPLTITVGEGLTLHLAQPDAPRRYALLVPPRLVGRADTAVRLGSPTFLPPSDTAGRALGVVLFEAGWQALAVPGWLVPAQALAITAAAALLLLLLLAQRVALAPRVLVLALLVAIMLAMRHSDPRFVYRANALVMTVGLCGLLAALQWPLWRYRPTAEPHRAWRSWLAAHGRALAGYAVVTAVMLFPLLPRINTHIFGFPGDNFEYLWKMQWFSDALVGQGVSPVYTPQIFFPSGADLTISEISPAHTLLGIPVTLLWGATVTYNLWVILSYALTACFTYLLARRLGARPGAAWVAGLIFAFCGRRVFHTFGHFGMLGTEWVVLTLYAWEGLLTRRRTWDGLLTGLAMSLTVWASWHYGTTLPLLIAAYTPLRWGLRRLPGLVGCWRPLVLACAIVVALALPLAQPYFEARQRGETYQHLYAQVVQLSTTPLSYLLPNPFHPLWGGWASQFYDPARGEQHAALGYTALLLALAGLWVCRRQPAAQALAVILLINLVMSFGPELRITDETALTLPARFFYDHVPVLGNIRNWSRMAMYVALCVALLAGLALSALPRRWGGLAAGLAAALVLAESAAALPLGPTAPREVDLWLRTQPGNGAVAQVPNGFGGHSEYATLFTGKPTAQGVGKFPPALYREGRDVLFGFPRESALRLAQRWQIDYLVVDEAAMTLLTPDWERQIAQQPLVREVYRAGGYRVYRVERLEA